MADKIRVLLTEEEVNARISEIAARINEDYEGKSVHLICILKGGVFFTCELAKRLTVPVTLDFMSVSSYGSGPVKRKSASLPPTDLKRCNLPDQKEYALSPGWRYTSSV